MKYFFNGLTNRFLPQGSAIRQISIVAGGTTLAQFLNIAVMPLLARIYSPDDFGILAVFTSITAILVHLSGFRYYRAIPLPKENHFATALVFLSFFLQIIVVSFVALTLLIIGTQVLEFFSIGILIPYKNLIPIAIAGMGIYITLTQWAIREQLFQTIARTKITQCISGIFTKIVFGILGFQPLGLLFGNIIGQAGGITTLSKSLFQKKGIPRPIKKDLYKVAVRYYKFPLFDTPYAIINTIGVQIMPLLLASFYTSQVTGLYAMAKNLLLIPSIFVGQAIGQVFLQRASVARHEGNLKNLSIRTFSILLKLGLFPVLLISSFAPSIFSFVLGVQWLEAGYFAMVLGPWIALSFAYSPLRSLFSVLEKQEKELAQEILYIFSRIGAFWIGTQLGGPLFAVGFYSLTGFLTLLFRVNYLLLAAGNSFLVIAQTNITIFVEALLLLLLPVGAFFSNLNIFLVYILLFISIVLYSIRTLRLLFHLR